MWQPDMLIYGLWTLSLESMVFLYKVLLENRASISGLKSEIHNTKVESLSKTTVFNIGQLPYTDKLQTY